MPAKVFSSTDRWELGPVDCLGSLMVIAPGRRARDPGSNPGPGENFSLKLLKYSTVHGRTVFL